MRWQSSCIYLKDETRKYLNGKCFKASGPLNPNIEAESWESEGSRHSSSEIDTERQQPRGNIHASPHDQSERTEPEDTKHTDHDNKFESRELQGKNQTLTMS